MSYVGWLGNGINIFRLYNGLGVQRTETKQKFIGVDSSVIWKWQKVNKMIDEKKIVRGYEFFKSLTQMRRVFCC